MGKYSSRVREGQIESKNEQKELFEAKESLLKEQLNNGLKLRKGLSKANENIAREKLQALIDYMVLYVFRCSKNDGDRIYFSILDGEHNNTIKEPIRWNNLVIDLEDKFNGLLDYLDPNNGLSKLIEIVQYKNYIHDIKTKRDFHSKEVFKKNIVGDKIILTYNDASLVMLEPDEFKLENIQKDYGLTNDEMDKIFDDIITEYGEVHYPVFFKELDFLVNSNLATARNKVLYINATAGGGKSIKTATRIGLNMNVVVKEKALEKEEGSSLNPSDFYGKLSADVEEATKWNYVYKNAVDMGLYIAAKYKSGVWLPVIPLMLHCATPILEIEETDNDEILERTNVFKLVLWKLEDRPMFQKYGKDLYFRIIGAFQYRYIKDSFNEFLKLSKKDAVSKANNFMKDFYKEYGAKNVFKKQREVKQTEIKEWTLSVIENILKENHTYFIDGLNMKQFIKRDTTNPKLVYITNIGIVYNRIISHSKNKDLIKAVESSFNTFSKLFTSSRKKSDNAEFTTGVKLNLANKDLFEENDVSMLNLDVVYSNLNIDTNKEIEVVFESNNKTISTTQNIKKPIQLPIIDEVEDFEVPEDENDWVEYNYSKDVEEYLENLN